MPSCAGAHSAEGMAERSDTPKKAIRKRPVGGSLSQEEIIEVDDTETPSPAKKPARSKALRSDTKLKDTDQLCEFPVGVSPNVTVALQDYKTLEHDIFLNDIIIDFYLTYLFENVLTREDKPNVHIFSTMFYKRLVNTPTKAKATSFEKDPNLSTVQKRHIRVKGWTKNVDLFKKDMIIVPICEHSHWYLVIVIKPGLIKLAVDSEERQTQGEPFFIVMDSMGDSKSTAVTNVRNYLAQEWKAKKQDEQADFNAKAMRTLRPVKPEQHNYSDCGIYLLHYVEKIFGSVAQFYWPGALNCLDSSWFPQEEVAKKRDELAKLIRDLSTEQRKQAGQAELAWPNICFVDRAPPPRKAKAKTDAMFDEYRPDDSDGEEAEEEKVLETVPGSAASFYGRGAGTRAAGRRERPRLNIRGLEEEALPAAERARRARHAGRDGKAARRGGDKAKGVKAGKPEEDWSYRPGRGEAATDEGNKALRDKMDKLKRIGADPKYKDRKMKQIDNNHIFDELKAESMKADEAFDKEADDKYKNAKKFRIPKKVKDGLEEDAGVELGTQHNFEATVPVRQKGSRQTKMESGAMDDLKKIAEETQEKQHQQAEPDLRRRKNKALDVFKEGARDQEKMRETAGKANASLPLSALVQSAEEGRRSQSFLEQKTNSASLGVKEILKDLEELEVEGSDAATKGEEEHKAKLPSRAGGSGVAAEVVTLETVSLSSSPSSSVPSPSGSAPSPPVSEELLTLEDSPSPLAADRLSPDLVEIIEDPEGEEPITGFLEKVPNHKPKISLSSPLPKLLPKLVLPTRADHNRAAMPRIQVDSDSDSAVSGSEEGRAAGGRPARNGAPVNYKESVTPGLESSEYCNVGPSRGKKFYVTESPDSPVVKRRLKAAKR